MGAWQRGLAAAAVAAVAVASFIGADAQVSRGILEIDTRGAVDVPRKAACTFVAERCSMREGGGGLGFCSGSSQVRPMVIEHSRL